MDTSDQFFTKRTIVIVCALICTGLWGSAIPCIKTGYALFQVASGDSAAQLVFAGTRFFLAGLLTILFGSILQSKEKGPCILHPQSMSAVGKVIVLSCFQTIGQYIFFYIGVAHTTAVKGSILTGCGSFISILLSCLFFKSDKLSFTKIVGCVLGFAGIVLVNLNGAAMDLSINLLGDGFMVISCLSSSISALIIKVYARTEDAVMLSGWQFAFGGAVMAVVGTLLGGRLSLVSAAGIPLILYMALISSVAYTLWGILLKYNPVGVVASFGFLIPVFGVLISALVLRDTAGITIYCLIALCLVSAGIFLVNRAK